MIFGKYGRKSTYPLTKRSIDAIAESDDGLQYLDWLCGELETDCKAWQAPTLEALQVYLGDATIKAEVAKLSPKPRVKTSTARTHAEAERQIEFPL